MLYPLKFKPLLKERIWGGRELERVFGKKLPEGRLIGESWELSGMDGDESVVCNGMLKGNSLVELIEVYMGDLVGDRVFEKFGEQMPLLVKFIDAHEKLSVQLHPNDKLAAERHNAYGKTEMWYVVDHEPGAVVYLGFNKTMSRDECLELLRLGEIEGALQKYEVKNGDVFFIPPGTVHAIGGGVVVVEIQQASDVTYRLFDYNRVDDKGEARELHIDLAMDAVDFVSRQDYKIDVSAVENRTVQIQSCPYFTSAITSIAGRVERDYSRTDSFVIYVCLEGSCQIICQDGSTESVKCGETLLLPSQIDDVVIKGHAKILEAWVS